MSLLHDHEEKFQLQGIQRRATFGFIASFFIHLGKGKMSEHDPNCVANFCELYVQPQVRPPLNECDYIFMPVYITHNRYFILLIFTVKDQKISILDPLYNDTPYVKLTDMYKEYVKVAGRTCNFLIFIINIYLYLFVILTQYFLQVKLILLTLPIGWCTDPKVHTVKGQSMQSNTCHYSIFVCKYVNYLVRKNGQMRM